VTRARIANLLDRQAQRADRLFGQKATFVRRIEGDLDIETGLQQDTTITKSVRVRSWPLSLKERTDLSAAGILDVETRWAMRVSYQSDISPGDVIRVGSFVYEVVAGGVSTDEHGVEHIILTRRRR